MRNRVGKSWMLSTGVMTATAALIACTTSTPAVASTAPVANSSGVHQIRAGAASLATRTVRTRYGTTATRQSGETLAQAVARQRARYGDLGVVRIFSSGFPTSWSTILPAVGRTPVSVSFKLAPSRVLSGEYDSSLRRWFNGAPTTRRTFWTYYHEPEDNIANGEFTASQFRAAWSHIARIARAAAAATGARLRATLILMGWTASRASGRNWSDYYSPGDVQVLGWDCYNGAASAGRYADPATFFNDVVAVSNSAHLPWAVPEFGSLLVAGDDGSGRAVWLSKTSTYAASYHARFVSYFDTNVGGDFRLLDQPSIQAWAATTPLT